MQARTFHANTSVSYTTGIRYPLSSIIIPSNYLFGYGLKRFSFSLINVSKVGNWSAFRFQRHVTRTVDKFVPISATKITDTLVQSQVQRSLSTRQTTPTRK